MDSLPVELVGKILTYLSRDDLAHFATVNSAWLPLCRSLLCETLVMASPNAENKTVIAIQSHPWVKDPVRNLVIKGDLGTVDRSDEEWFYNIPWDPQWETEFAAFHSVVSTLASVQTLTLQDVDAAGGFRWISDLAQSFPQLQSLRLYNVFFHDTKEDYPAELSPFPTSVRALTVHLAYPHSTHALRWVAESPKMDIRYLSLLYDEDNLDEQVQKSFVRRTAPIVERLDLSLKIHTNELPFAHVIRRKFGILGKDGYVLSAVENYTKLKCLRLPCVKLESDAMDGVAGAMKSHPSLEKVVIPVWLGSYIDDDNELAYQRYKVDWKEALDEQKAKWAQVDAALCDKQRFPSIRAVELEMYIMPLDASTDRPVVAATDTSSPCLADISSAMEGLLANCKASKVLNLYYEHVMVGLPEEELPEEYNEESGSDGGFVCSITFD